MYSEFANIVEGAKKLSSNEKKELKFLLEKYLIEERREEMNKNHKKSLTELDENRLEFSSDINNLKDTLE